MTKYILIFMASYCLQCHLETLACGRMKSSDVVSHFSNA